MTPDEAAKKQADAQRAALDGPPVPRAQILAAGIRVDIFPTQHPWEAFLQARMRCLAWLRDEMKETPEQTVVTMRMDPAQVQMLLKTYDESVRKT
jgi:hypothetical protein